MFEARHIDGDTWEVTETGAQGTVLGTHTVAVQAGGTGEDAIATIVEARTPPRPDPAQMKTYRAGLGWVDGQAVHKHRPTRGKAQ